MGRYSGDSGEKSKFGWWLMVWITWLCLFILLLPQIMCNGDFGCTTVPTTNLLYLWWFVLTLGGGTIPYLDFVFGVWAALIVFGTLDLMD